MATQTTKSVKEQPRLGFEFEAIDLNTAYDLVPQSHRSKYLELKEGLIAQMKTAPAAALRFGQTKEGTPELPERERRGICNACNDALREEKMNYRVTYSGKGRCFVVIPFKRYSKKSKPEGVARGPYKKKDGRIGSHGDAPAKAVPRTAQGLFKAAQGIFGVTGPALVDNDAMRRSFAFVAHEKGVGQADIARLLGKTNWATRGYIECAQRKHQAEIKQLMTAMNGAGA